MSCSSACGSPVLTSRFSWLGGLGPRLHSMGNGGPNCLLAADSFKVGQDMGKQRKQMHKNKAAWKTSGVGCEKLESIFTMHASQFSLLLCHCFEKSKLCLQKCNVCIHMYESMQLSRGEAGKRNGRLRFQKEPEASGKIHFLPQVSGGSRQQTLLRDVLKRPVITQGGFYVSLEPTFFPPFLQSRLPLPFPGLWLPNWSPSHQWFSTKEILLPQGCFCCCCCNRKDATDT